MAESNLPIPDPTQLTTSALHREIAHLKEEGTHGLDTLEKQQNIKFDNIQQQFNDRDKRVEETAESIRREVKLAFDAQKEAAQKAEDGAKELVAALSREQGDVKDRVVRMESRREGSGVAVSWIISGVMLLLAIVGGVVALVTKMSTGH